MKKTRDYIRYQHKKHALRHKKITENVYQELNYFDTFNKYDSFKIHCSCPLCAAKTNSRGKRGAFWASSKNWKISDRRKLDELEYQEDEELTLE